MYSRETMIYTPDQHIPVGVVIVSREGVQLQIKREKKEETISYAWLDAEVRRVARNMCNQD